MTSVQDHAVFRKTVPKNVNFDNITTSLNHGKFRLQESKEITF